LIHGVITTYIPSRGERYYVVDLDRAYPPQSARHGASTVGNAAKTSRRPRRDDVVAAHLVKSGTRYLLQYAAVT